MKILIICSSSFGDIILSTPLFRCLKRQIADAEVHLLTQQEFAPATSANPFIEKTIFLSPDLDSLNEQLKVEHYDFIIDLDNNYQSKKIKHTLKKKFSTIHRYYLWEKLLTRFKVDLMPQRHITLRCLDAARPLGIRDDGLGLDFFIPEDGLIREDDLPHSHIAGFVVIIISASQFTKRMPIHKVKELCSKIDFPIVLVGDKDQQVSGDEISSLDTIKIYNACGKFTLFESASIIKKSRVVISMDSGIQYIACVFKKPLLTLWGGTSPKLQADPYYGSIFMNKNPEIHENIYLNLWCQPCSKEGLPYCPLRHFNCMEKQNTTFIAQKTMEMIQKFPLAI